MILKVDFQKKQNVLTFVIFILFLFHFLLGACSKNGAQNSKKINTAIDRRSAVTIGVIGPFSGKQEDLGRPVLEGVQFAVDEINQKGGIRGKKINLRIMDDQFDPELTAQKTKELVEDGQTLIVLGGRSTKPLTAIGKVIKSGSLPAITGSPASDGITAGNLWFFRATFGEAVLSHGMVDYAKEVFGNEMIEIVAIEPQGKGANIGFKEWIEKNKMQLVEEHKATDGPGVEKQIDDMVAKITKRKSNAIILLASGTESGHYFLKTLREAGNHHIVIGIPQVGFHDFNDYFKDFPQEKKSPGFYTNNFYSVSVGLSDIAGERAQRFYNKFYKDFGHKAASISAGNYDATLLAIEALENVRFEDMDIATARKSLREYLAGISSPEKALAGVTGKIYFNQQLTAVSSPLIGAWVNGELIAAPTQLHLIQNPQDVPNFEENMAAKQIIQRDLPEGPQYMSRVQVVYTGIDVVDISDINQRTGEYTADMFVWFRYVQKFSVQDLEFANATKPVDFGPPIWTRSYQGMNIATYRVKATFQSEFNFADYPLDKQKLFVKLRHRTKTLSNFILASDSLGMKYNDRNFEDVALEKLSSSFSTSTWRPISLLIYQNIFKSDSTLGEMGKNFKETGLEYSQINATIEISRNGTSYLIKNLLPLILLLIVLFISNYISAEMLPVRASIGITGLLTAMVLYQRLSQDLPSIGYLILMDYGFFLVFAISILKVLLGILVYIAAKDGSERRIRYLKIVGLATIPLILISCTLWIWLKYGYLES